MIRIISLLKFMAVSFFLFLISGCAGTALQRTTVEPPGKFLDITDISKGLPAKGLWRQNVALADMRGDGFLSIIAPPPRKPKPDQRRPFIFEWDKKNGRWVEGDFRFPPLDYGYGGIAVGDLNNDGYPDIALATHSGRIFILLNDGRGGFTESAFPVRENFHSRTIGLSDVNGDGSLDLIALSEFGNVSSIENSQSANSPEAKAELRKILELPKGIVLGISKPDGKWDIREVKESEMLFGDSLATGNVTGGRLKDILIAPLTTNEFWSNKVLWTGDGNGNFSFKEHSADALRGYMASSVKTGDVDGDGAAEAVFLIGQLSNQEGKMEIRAFKWAGNSLKELSPGPDPKARPIVFNLFDIDGDGRDELVVLCADGLHIYRYDGKGWLEIGSHAISSADTTGAYGITVGKNSDGSLIIVYNLGNEYPKENTGLRAFRVRMK
jgi:hypothetical protein